MSTHIWFRAETKLQEERAALTPLGAKKLIEAGFQITVEESADRAFDLSQYAAVGCRTAESHSWIDQAPDEAIVLGLKELDDREFPLRHRHIHFAHVYKEQKGWREVLGRFIEGGGTLYDLEYLVDEKGRRIAAFGYWAGFAGAALAVQAWCGAQRGDAPILGPIGSRSSQSELINEIKAELKQLIDKPVPRALVIGAAGRSGQGAVQAIQDLGLEVVEWDIAETKGGGPFEEILNFEILINCVFVQQAIPPFLDRDLLDRTKRRLSMICDVSCDPYGDYNPLPIYDQCTTFPNPTRQIVDGDDPVYLIAIDHLPSLLPVESSIDYGEQLLPALLQLGDLETPVWKRAEQLFLQKCQEAGE